MGTKTVLITGASRGFGKLVADSLLDLGHTVICAIRGGESRLSKLFSPMAIGSGRLFALDLHLEKTQDLQSARSLIQERFGDRLDVLINNAGYGLMGPLEPMTPDELRHQMEVGFFGPVFLTQALIPCLRKSRGRVINVSSIAGIVSYPYFGAYNASKHALEGYTEALYYELQREGIQVGLVEPGAFKTEFSSHAQFAKEITQPQSTFHDRYLAFSRFYHSEARRISKDPRVVSERIVKLCQADHVPLRSVIGVDAKVLFFLKRLLPEDWRARFTNWVFWKWLIKK